MFGEGGVLSGGRRILMCLTRSTTLIPQGPCKPFFEGSSFSLSFHAERLPGPSVHVSAVLVISLEGVFVVHRHTNSSSFFNEGIRILPALSETPFNAMAL